MSSQRFWLSSRRPIARVSVPVVAGERKTSSTAHLTQYSKGRFGSWLGVLPTSFFVNRLQPATSENASRVARDNAFTPAARRATPWKKRIQRSALEYWYPWRSAASVKYAGRHRRSSAISVCFLRYDPSPSIWPEPRRLSKPLRRSSSSPECFKPEMPRTSWNAAMCNPRLAIAGPGHAFKKNLMSSSKLLRRSSMTLPPPLNATTNLSCLIHEPLDRGQHKGSEGPFATRQGRRCREQIECPVFGAREMSAFGFRRPTRRAKRAEEGGGSSHAAAPALSRLPTAGVVAAEPQGPVEDRKAAVLVLVDGDFGVHIVAAVPVARQSG